MVMEIRVKATVTVRPARPTPRRTLWSTNVDLLYHRGYSPVVYFYRPPDGSPPAGFFDAAVLREALAEVLVPFYPAAGRIRRDSSGRVDIDCNGEGVVFVEAESNVGLDEIRDLGYENGPRYMQLVPQPAAFGSEHDVSACPLLLLQVTRFSCGGASLGSASNHLLFDGFALTHLIKSWADAARGAFPLTPPFLDRTALTARDPPAPSFPHPEYHEPPPSLALGSPQQPFVAATFRLTPADIDCLKSRGAKAAGGPCGTFEAIVAHTWRCACIARGLRADQRTRVHMPVSVRGRLHPPLPPSYLGNAIFSIVCDATAGEVTGGKPVVGKVRAALARVDDAYVRSAVDYLQLQPDLSKLKRGAHVYGSPNLNVNSFLQLPTSVANFGWGPPVFMGPARVLCEGNAYVLPGPSAEEGLSLVIGLSSAAMECFSNIFYDFQLQREESDPTKRRSNSNL